MKIVQLDIQGFRSLKNVSWRPGDLNVVIGPNGSGKSNLLRMLELISAAAQGKLSDYVQAEGGMGAIVWDGQAEAIEYHLETSGWEDKTPESSFQQELVLRQVGRGSTYLVWREFLWNGDREHFYLERLLGNSAEVSDSGRTLALGKEDLKTEETVLSTMSRPFIQELAILFFKASVTEWAIYSDLRVDADATLRQAPVSRLEQRVSPDGQNLINVLHTLYSTDRKFKQDINDAMLAAFGADFDELIFPPAADQRIQMRVRWKTLKREQSAADLSDGTLRFLFLITVLAAPNPPPLIAIDEPETGLHPSMLPIIAEYAVEAATRTQVIFTTHSDEFLSAFRDTRPTVTVAKWENGETTLTTVEDNELAYWVEDYSLGQLFRSGELENLAS